MIATIGTFDGVHTGHLFLIEEMKKYVADANIKSVAVTFDVHPLSVINPDKSPALLNSLSQKEKLLSESGVDRVIVLHFDNKLRETSAIDFLRILRKEYSIDTIAIGYNNTIGADVNGFDNDFLRDAEKEGFKFIKFPQTESKVSSTKIRKEILDGDIEKANEMLGYEYTISGTVVHGQNIGHTLGFPTANVIPCEPKQIIPPIGVYSVRAIVNDVEYMAVVNIGHRPTINKNNFTSISIEVHIINFSDYIYGENISIKFLSKIRDEKKFNSLHELKTQIEQDVRLTLLSYET